MDFETFSTLIAFLLIYFNTGTSNYFSECWNIQKRGKTRSDDKYADNNIQFQRWSKIAMIMSFDELCEKFRRSYVTFANILKV